MANMVLVNGTGAHQARLPRVLKRKKSLMISGGATAGRQSQISARHQAKGSRREAAVPFEAPALAPCCHMTSLAPLFPAIAVS